MDTPTTAKSFLDERVNIQEEQLSEALQRIQDQQDKIELLEDMVQALMVCYRNVESELSSYRSRSSSLSERESSVPLYGTCFGFLFKLSSGLGSKQWKKRWFVLKDDGTFCYWKTMKQSHQEPGDRISIIGTQVYRHDDTPNSLFGFRIVGKSRKPILLAASSESERNKWMKALAEGIAVARLNSTGQRASISGWDGVNARKREHPTCQEAMDKASHREWLTCMSSDGSLKTLYCTIVDSTLYGYSSLQSKDPSDIINIVGLEVKDASANGRLLLELRKVGKDVTVHRFVCETDEELLSWHHALTMACSAATHSAMERSVSPSAISDASDQ